MAQLCRLGRALQIESCNYVSQIIRIASGRRDNIQCFWQMRSVMRPESDQSCISRLNGALRDRYDYVGALICDYW